MSLGLGFAALVFGMLGSLNEAVAKMALGMSCLPNYIFSLDATFLWGAGALSGIGPEPRVGVKRREWEYNPQTSPAQVAVPTIAATRIHFCTVQKSVPLGSTVCRVPEVGKFLNGFELTRRQDVTSQLKSSTFV